MRALENVDTSGRKSQKGPWLHTSRDDVEGGSETTCTHKKATLIYLDPWALTRDCVGRWLEDSLENLAHRVVSDPEELDSQILTNEHIHEVIVNTGPERMSSTTVTQTLVKVSELLPAVPITILSHHEDAESIREAFELGVSGYIPASLAGQVAVGAVQLVGLGGKFAPPGVLLSQTGPASTFEPAGEKLIEGFTQRQSQILDCLQRGMANKLIAYELSMCESTVKVHIRNIMKKLNATNRTEVAYLTRDFFKERATAPSTRDETGLI